MPRAVAINVGANTNEPGFRGPVYPDGSFEFVPIPETEPTSVPVPTYADLDLRLDVPAAVRDVPVHLDPEFPSVPGGEAYTYGDPHGVKARPIRDLSAGDWLCFYATLSARGTGHPEWVVPDWGAYLVGWFELAADPLSGEAFRALPDAERARFASNAHCKRETFDAAVLARGSERSRLFETPVPLSGETGTAANRLVTDLSADSGKGPWWRRPLRYDADATAALRAAVASFPESPVR